MRLSYLFNGNPYTGKKIFLYITTAPMLSFHLKFINSYMKSCAFPLF